jgi:Na+-driven multidrug efflux pump
VVTVSNALSMFLNGVGLLRSQAFLTALAVVMNLALSIVLTRRFGIPGVLWGTVIAQSCCFLIPVSLIARRALYAQGRMREATTIERSDRTPQTAEGRA